MPVDKWRKSQIEMSKSITGPLCLLAQCTRFLKKYQSFHLGSYRTLFRLSKWIFSFTTSHLDINIWPVNLNLTSKNYCFSFWNMTTSLIERREYKNVYYNCIFIWHSHTVTKNPDSTVNTAVAFGVSGNDISDTKLPGALFVAAVFSAIWRWNYIYFQMIERIKYFF